MVLEALEESTAVNNDQLLSDLHKRIKENCDENANCITRKMLEIVFFEFLHAYREKSKIGMLQQIAIAIDKHELFLKIALKHCWIERGSFDIVFDTIKADIRSDSLCRIRL